MRFLPLHAPVTMGLQLASKLHEAKANQNLKQGKGELGLSNQIDNDQEPSEYLFDYFLMSLNPIRYLRILQVLMSPDCVNSENWVGMKT
jgi:hypothetical protein